MPQASMFAKHDHACRPLLALALLALTLQDAFEVMLLPRRVIRRLPFVSLFYRLIWKVWAGLPAFRRHERVEE